MRAPVILAVLAAAAVGLGLLWWNSQAEVRAVPDAAAPGQLALAAPGPEEPPGGARAPEPVTLRFATNYYDAFLSSNDLSLFAKTMYGLAVEGDDAGQYWLFRALQRCGLLYDQVFEVKTSTSGPTQLTVDQVAQRELRNPWFGAQEAGRLQEQCAHLRTPAAAQYGRADEWLARASAGGYPLAQIWMASELADTNGAKARQLTIAALGSGDPDVIRQTEAVAAQLMHGESAREQQQWLWTILGCKRGAHCGPEADWVRAECARDRHCQPHEGGLDIVRRRTGPQFSELEEVAGQLGAKIDAHDWEELGL